MNELVEVSRQEAEKHEAAGFLYPREAGTRHTSTMMAMIKLKRMKKSKTMYVIWKNDRSGS